MPIARLAKAKQRLQQAVDRGRGKEVPSTHDVGHPLKGVIDHHREVIARRQIAPAEDDVAPNLRRPPDAAQEWRPRRIRSSSDARVRRRWRAAC